MEQKPKAPQGQTSRDKEFNLLLSEINTVINRRITLYAKSEKKDVLIRRLTASSHEIRLQPTSAGYFYFHEEIERIVRKHGWSIMWRAEVNLRGLCAPVMEIYREL